MSQSFRTFNYVSILALPSKLRNLSGRNLAYTYAEAEFDLTLLGHICANASH
jgi:hypothetical protein